MSSTSTAARPRADGNPFTLHRESSPPIVVTLGERLGKAHLVSARDASAELVATGLFGYAGFSGWIDECGAKGDCTGSSLVCTFRWCSPRGMVGCPGCKSEQIAKESIMAV